MYLISACIAGVNCKYDGHNNFHRIAKELVDANKAVLACPEELGGLPTPRTPCEIKEGKVISKTGDDVSSEFRVGASKTLEIAKKHNVKIAIMQKRSPSCGVHQIYDGTFTSSLISGQGVTTTLLQKNGIKVITIDEYIEQYYQYDFK